MKRLEYCQAWYDDIGLVSYETRIIEFDYSVSLTPTVPFIEYYNYRSKKTLLHIRKYIDMLRKTEQAFLADRIQSLYDFAKINKNIEYIYMSSKGEIVL